MILEVLFNLNHSVILQYDSFTVSLGINRFSFTAIARTIIWWWIGRSLIALMDDQGIFVLHALLTCNKTTVPFLELEIIHISISCNFITEYSATDINRFTCCHDGYLWSYINDLGFANTRRGSGPSHCYWVEPADLGLVCPTWFDEQIASLFWQTSLLPFGISSLNFQTCGACSYCTSA